MRHRKHTKRSEPWRRNGRKEKVQSTRLRDHKEKKSAEQEEHSDTFDNIEEIEQTELLVFDNEEHSSDNGLAEYTVPS